MKKSKTTKKAKRSTGKKSKRRVSFAPFKEYYAPTAKRSRPKKHVTVKPLLGSHALHPGDVLLQMHLAPKGMTQAEMTDKLGWKLTRLNKLINGKGGVTALSAMDIARVTKTKPEYWLKLQLDYDLERARESHRWSRIKRK